MELAGGVEMTEIYYIEDDENIAGMVKEYLVKKEFLNEHFHPYSYPLLDYC